mgnify:CR=1 FL=1
MAQPQNTAEQSVDQKTIVSMRNVNKWFGQFHVLRDINLSVDKGERIVVCGPSGSGKSTLIRCLNRLEKHQDGDIFVHGIELNNDVKNIDEIRREVGMVFQHFNLFPHLSIRDNVRLAVASLPRLEQIRLVDSTLNALGLGDLKTTDPFALSRGQMMRVSIARALVRPPQLLLLDEPFSALDSNTRDRVRDVVFDRAHAAGSHVILVTHSEDDRPTSETGQVICLTRS